MNNMTIKSLYKTIRLDGGTTVSPNKPLDGVEYTERVRLIADEGKLVTLDGVKAYPCVDVDSADGWYEVQKEITNREELKLTRRGAVL